MGSPLGPTFADFFMSHNENFLLSQKKVSNTLLYVRYVDDIFCVINNQRHVRFFKQRMENNCVLKFTTIEKAADKFNLLDVSIKRLNDNKLQAGVFVKHTDSRIYASFEPHTPLQYKRLIVKSLVNKTLRGPFTQNKKIFIIRSIVIKICSHM